MSWFSSIDPTRAVKQLGRFVDPTSAKSGTRKALRGVDNAVGGAKGWSNVTGAITPVLAVIPVVGPALAAGSAGATALLRDKAASDAKSRAIRLAASPVPYADGVGGAIGASSLYPTFSKPVTVAGVTAPVWAVFAVIAAVLFILLGRK